MLSRVGRHQLNRDRRDGLDAQIFSGPLAVLGVRLHMHAPASGPVNLHPSAGRIRFARDDMQSSETSHDSRLNDWHVWREKSLANVQATYLTLNMSTIGRPTTE